VKIEIFHNSSGEGKTIEHVEIHTTKFVIQKVSSSKYMYTVKPVLRGHFWNKEIVTLWDRWPPKRGSIHMNFFMTGKEKSDLLIQVTP